MASINFHMVVHGFVHIVDIKGVMNAQVLQAIRCSMCPKDKWVPDRDVTNCYKCDSRFNKLYRWKHHCRICGKIFCSPCCEFYIMGSDLGEEDKPLRTCELCNRKFWSYLMDKDREYYLRRKADPVYEEKLMAVQEVKQQIKQPLPKRMSKTDRQKTGFIQSLVTDFQIQADPMPLSKLWHLAESKLSLVLQIIMKTNKIPFSFYELLLKIIKRVVVEVPPNAMVTGNMNICANVKIKYEKSQVVGARYVAGTVLRKAMTSKKMPTTFENVSIALMFGSCEVVDLAGIRANSFVSFEEMVQNRKKHSAKIMEKLTSMGVKMLFLEGTIDRETQDLMFSRDIVVFSKVDVDILTKLKISLEIGKIIDGVSDLQKAVTTECVGISKLVYFTKVARFDEQDESALIVEGLKPSNGMTIILAGPNETTLKLLKYELKQIVFRIARHLILKIYKMSLDQDMIQSMNPEIRASLSHPAAANLFFSSNFENEGTLVGVYLNHRYVRYNRIVFVESDYAPSSMPEITKQLAEDYRRRKYRCFRSKWKFFTEICQQHHESRQVYSSDDLPVGQYLLKKLLGSNTRCEHCRRIEYQHTEVLYWAHLYTSIEVESRIIQKQDCSDTFDNQSIFQQLSKLKDHKIESYIQCYDCHFRLSDKFVLRKEHLQLSFLSYVVHHFLATHITLLKYPPSESKGPNCLHFRKCRVFQLGSYFLRFYTDFLVLSPEFKLSQEQVSQHSRQKQSKALNEVCMQFSMNIEQVVGYINAEVQKVAEQNKNVNLEVVRRNPKESFIKAVTCYHELGKQAVLTKNQYLQLFIPESMEHLNRIMTVSYGQLSPKSCRSFFEAWRIFAGMCSLLNRILQSIKFLSKSKTVVDIVQHRFHRQSMDSTFFVEDVDINAQLEEERAAFHESHRIMGLEHDVEPSWEMKENNTAASDIGSEKFSRNEVSQSPPKIGPSVPSLMSRKLRKTESAMYESIGSLPSKQMIEGLLKSVTSTYGTAAYLNDMPCNSTCQSIISNALNSEFHKDALRKGLDQVVIKLTTGQAQFNYEQQDLRKISSVLEAHELGLNIPKSKKLSTENYTQVTMLFPREFQNLRQANGISTDDFISTIACTAMNSVQSKSGSYVLQSCNEMLSMRFTTECQFQIMHKMLPKYFKHVEQPTLLVKLYGAYEVTRNSKSEYVVIMENSFFGMEQWQIYDFKGLRWRRFNKPPQIAMDVNFLLDRNSQPLFSSCDVLRHLKRTLQFLVECQISDYSLSLIISIDQPATYLDGCRIKLCISNYIQSKSVMSISSSNIDAASYADRLLKGVRKYFWRIPE